MIVNADCLEYLKTMADGSVDAIVTDPPYELSDGSKQSPHRIFLEMMFPDNSKIKSISGVNELSFLIDKVVELYGSGCFPAPSTTMPKSPVALQDNISQGQINVVNKQELSLDIPNRKTCIMDNSQIVQDIGNFYLKFTDFTKMLKILNTVGTGFNSGFIRVGSTIPLTSFPSFLHRGGIIGRGNNVIRCNTDSFTSFIRTHFRTKELSMFDFPLLRGDNNNVFTTCSALAFLSFLEISGTQLIRTSTATCSLPAMLKTTNICFVNQITNRAISFNLITHNYSIQQNGFMSKGWDGSKIAFDISLWQEALRVLKHGGHLLAFSSTRTYHRMACAIEDAGFEVRDMIEWVYSSGFPSKNFNIGKAIDKLQGNAREVTGKYVAPDGKERGGFNNNPMNITNYQKGNRSEHYVTKGTSEWEGWGTALKPAHEPICMARKPLEKGLTVAKNVLKWGTGGINIDGSRVETKDNLNGGGYDPMDKSKKRFLEDTIIKIKKVKSEFVQPTGRYPANLIHDGSDEVRECFPDTKPSSRRKVSNKGSIWGSQNDNEEIRGHDDNGGNISRCFKSIIYQAKASPAERNKGCEELEKKENSGSYHFREDGSLDGNPTGPKSNFHPTVKPIKLIEYLINMITKEDYVVLDPFMGSGTTGVACKNLKRNFVGIELDEKYFDIAKRRILSTQERLL